jgi:aminoglycoside phosphotransferase family enzyme/predicted kinase
LSTTPSSQAEVAQFLNDPQSYAAKPLSVQRIDTHGAMIFLAGNEVWKIKRDINFPYMDFSSLEKRRVVCWREVELNRQTAPKLYIGAASICRAADGKLNLRGKGEPVEWAVRMHRFDQDALLENIAARGDLSDPLIRSLADHIAEFHGKIRRAIDLDFAATMRRIALELIDGYALQPELFSAHERAEFSALINVTVAQQANLLRARSHEGFVRRCHGDLHLRNIVVIDGQPILFDALEFDEGFATTDILYDIAFLVMDLWQRGLHHSANLLLNRYLISIGLEPNIPGLAAMPLFLSVRAGIRAMVVAERAQLVMNEKAKNSSGEAMHYFHAALLHLKPVPPRIVAIGGLSGTGKSTLAAAIAHKVGAPPGALHLRSDIERKLMHGVAETTRLSAAAYSQVTTQKVYDALMVKCRHALAASQAVIVDAVFSRPEERQAAEQIARDQGLPFQGIWLSAPADHLFSRVAERHSDASDADLGVVRQQLSRDIGPVSWARIDAHGPPENVQAEAIRLLESS